MRKKGKESTREKKDIKKLKLKVSIWKKKLESQRKCFPCIPVCKCIIKMLAGK